MSTGLEPGPCAALNACSVSRLVRMSVNMLCDNATANPDSMNE
jgi:hypothetical protein